MAERYRIKNGMGQRCLLSSGHKEYPHHWEDPEAAGKKPRQWTIQRGDPNLESEVIGPDTGGTLKTVIEIGAYYGQKARAEKAEAALLEIWKTDTAEVAKDPEIPFRIAKEALSGSARATGTED